MPDSMRFTSPKPLSVTITVMTANAQPEAKSHTVQNVCQACMVVSFGYSAAALSTGAGELDLPISEPTTRPARAMPKAQRPVIFASHPKKKNGMIEPAAPESIAKYPPVVFARGQYSPPTTDT